MSLPFHNDDELTRWVKHILTRWKMGHDVSAAIMQATCLGMPIKREDYLLVVRKYCDQHSENRRLGKVNK